ncbi:MAG: fibronectin type III domain-containing protein [Roseiarcus sp.]|jgi:hypothetical protein
MPQEMYCKARNVLLTLASLLFPVILFFGNVAYATTCDFGTSIGGGQCRGYLTSGTTWTVPADWNSVSNTIEALGSGGIDGSSGPGNPYDDGTGGIGGAYSAVSNLSLTPGRSIGYAVGAGGLGPTDSDTYFCNATSSCGAITGSSVKVGAQSGTNGGSATNGVGTTKYSGGLGGWDSDDTGAGGGGAAGPHGNGDNGPDCSGGTHCAPSGHAGNGDGDNGFGGIGDGQGASNGTEWDASHGTGGGGAGSVCDGNATGGGLYGGGAGSNDPCQSGSSNPAAPGLIVITYASLPSAPGKPTFSSVTTNTLTVSWTASTNVTTYNVYRCSGLSCKPTLLTTGVGTTSYNDSGLTAYTLYTYYIIGVNSSGNGPASASNTTATSFNAFGRIIRLRGHLRLRGGVRLE